MNQLRRRASHLLLVAIMLFACVVSARAQDTTARISGQITDAAGAAIPNAEITLVNTNTREERKTKTDDSGYYALT
ncbi:MAG: carboxypeptidase-like regulatory domain-containing protein, partial [Pyrinomonadaceae bacterium]